eukprot:CAMPEP_0170094068 /NCGR_PEP_ID=MMETSP0019_2-20121128/26975_1 /TAXON_ID=98059 /ORGANISM="Dinobryon sp., Strain UTEXLB2267" /LENGTH=348 /DNA_ID=CAMNT_0010315207 /DNA_START=592 /DNA_END=1635 /DNA_ORIENTATION=-
MPLLPFFAMEQGATALHISFMVSSNYVAQMIGCILVGKVSDTYGRRPVVLLCLLASALSYLNMSKSYSIIAIALSRIISGSFGGLVPIMQSTVADCSNQQDRPKYIGRITATFGLGFVLGPLLCAMLSNFSTRKKFRFAALMPLLGGLVTLIFAKETNKNAISIFDWPIKQKIYRQTTPSNQQQVEQKQQQLTSRMLLLVLNGFLLMFSFSTESIYPVFAKDRFGYDDLSVSKLLAFTGVLVGLFQTCGIKPLIGSLGKHLTLAVGNFLLATGLVGIGFIRQQLSHNACFACHVLGYAIADTALASLVIYYSSPQSQGRNLALSQAAQACARVISPLTAGYLYSRSMW